MSISDHLAQFLLIPLDTGFIPKHVYTYKQDTKNYDKENFFLDLISTDFKNEMNFEKRDPNHSFDKMLLSLNSLIDKYMPVKKMSKKEIKNQNSPWINKEIQEKIKTREKLYKKYVKSKNPTIKENYHKQFKEIRNEIVDDIRESKKQFYQSYFSKNSNNIKETWKGIKTIINIKNKSKNYQSSLLVDNNLITDPKKVADSFNDYFSSIADNLQKKIRNHGKHFTEYLKDPNPHTFFLRPTTKTEVINTITAHININKGVGPNSTPSVLLHTIKHTIAEPLADLINLSFETGIYIDKLKIAKVMAVFKDKGSDLERNNFRPISLLSNINKIFEKLMHERVYSFLEIYNCIFELQFGFRLRHSTNHALIDLTEDIREAIDNNNFAVGVFIDLQKAFDTVDHQILLKKLDHYGIRGTANKWFESYLTNRKQFVTINGVDSDLKIMKYGVPQGSVLGPLLFLLYINDLHVAIKHCTTRHFADDTNLLIKGKSLKKLKKYLNIDLKNLSYWLKANKISLNAGKTELLLLRNPKKIVNYDLKVKLEGKRLFPSNFVKYLGINIDSHLNWNFHVQTLAPKLTRAVGMLKKIRHYVNLDTLKNIYHAIFGSLMQYGCQIWGQKINSHVKRIVKLQNRAIRVINFKDYQHPTEKLYKDSKILKFQDHISLLNYLFVSDSLMDNLPKSLCKQFSNVHQIHSHPTKNLVNHCITLPKSRTINYGIHSIMGQSCRNYNFLQINCNSQSIHTKSRYLKKDIITKYFLNSYYPE